MTLGVVVVLAVAFVTTAIISYTALAASRCRRRGHLWIYRDGRWTCKRCGDETLEV